MLFFLQLRTPINKLIKKRIIKLNSIYLQPFSHVTPFLSFKKQSYQTCQGEFQREDAE